MGDVGVNEVRLIGRLGRDPKMTKGEDGYTRTAFSLATNEQWTDRDGNRQERVEWHNVVVWGKAAEAAGTYLSTGRRVYVAGRIRTRKWTDTEGAERYITEIQADRCVYLDSDRDGDRAEKRTAEAPAPGPEPEPEQPREDRAARQQRLLREGRERGKQMREEEPEERPPSRGPDPDIPFAFLLAILGAGASWMA
jgi:single-strand DNA-binding protein